MTKDNKRYHKHKFVCTECGKTWTEYMEDIRKELKELTKKKHGPLLLTTGNDGK